MSKLSIVLPARNEASSLRDLLPRLKSAQPDAEIVVVNDDSSDETLAICEANEVRVVTHPYRKGNGAAIKTGAQAATGDILVFMDADGQHRPEDISRLLEKYHSGYHMVIGARSSRSQASAARRLANGFYNRFAGWIVGQNIDDLTSGFRVVNASKFREFLFLLPNGFSYPTTITMAFFRAGFSVSYVPIEADKRIGKSHISLLKDGFRFILIIFRIGTLYSPLKLFVPISFLHFLAGLAYYAYTFIYHTRFTNMSALLFLASLLIFFIGLVSEQITMLLFMRRRD